MLWYAEDARQFQVESDFIRMVQEVASVAAFLQVNTVMGATGDILSRKIFTNDI